MKHVLFCTIKKLFLFTFFFLACVICSIWKRRGRSWWVSSIMVEITELVVSIVVVFVLLGTLLCWIAFPHLKVRLINQYRLSLSQIIKKKKKGRRKKNVKYRCVQDFIRVAAKGSYPLLLRETTEADQWNRLSYKSSSNWSYRRTVSESGSWIWDTAETLLVPTAVLTKKNPLINTAWIQIPWKSSSFLFSNQRRVS